MPEIITRDAARARGLKRFFTGVPCKRGHVAERYVVGTGGAMCIECGRSGRQPRIISEGQYAAARDRTRVRHAARDGYAPPPSERDCLPRPADGRCDCCLVLVIGPFHMDHDHITGAFRGWTCDGCNVGRGMADDPDKLRTRADFLDGTLPWQ